MAVSPRSLQGEQGEFIKKHFNSLTAGKVDELCLLQPEEGKFNWEDADRIVAFAMENGMKVRGHTLCWHITRQGNGCLRILPATRHPKSFSLQDLKNISPRVVSRYKGKVYAWDVLNEAIDNADPSKGFRETLWYKICGEEFIGKAFRWAHEADPMHYCSITTSIPMRTQ